MSKKLFVVAAILIVATFALASCAGPAGPQGPAGAQGPAGPQGPAGEAPKAADLTCTQCHNDTTIIVGHADAWAGSMHATGFAGGYAGGRSTCAGCHSGSGFMDRIAAGEMNPDNFKTAYADASRIDCRACHQIHTTYTADDFALRTVAAVPLYAIQGTTFDKGMGNLCANCHQSRRAFPAADADGNVKVDSTHWGAHHGPVAEMLLGVGASPDVQGTPGPHYTMTTDSCVTCHMGGDAADHNFSTPATVAYCQACHADAKNFDINGAVTKLDAKLEAVKEALTTNGLLDEKGTIVVGTYPAAKAAALWNFLFVEEDKSHGVHNMNYANALLDQALAALGK